MPLEQVRSGQLIRGVHGACVLRTEGPSLDVEHLFEEALGLDVLAQVQEHVRQSHGGVERFLVVPA